MPTDRDGRRIAILLRQALELRETRACDLDFLLSREGIEVIVSEHEDPGFTACLLPMDEAPGIVVAKGLSEGRRRFSLAHELGHYHIPSHSDLRRGCECEEGDLRAREEDSKRREWEANDFAAELLMPWKLFAEDVHRLDVSVAAVQRLAGPAMYNVSQLAAAWRVIQATREAAAVVISRGGNIEWAVKSNACTLWLPDYGTRLSVDSVAASALRGDGFIDKPCEVPIHAWTTTPNGQKGRLLESCYGIDRTNQVVSLLWQVESESRGDDD